MMGQMMGGGAMMVILWLLLVAVLVLGVVFLVRALTERANGAPGGGGSDWAALRILEERHARGEIDRDEFEERRRTLRS
ncbi:MAG: hypothetical protein GEU79_01350 [Acidimicrobiia bacterium]|nr:hypothetical protein [Acidimicrobiia bacterium]